MSTITRRGLPVAIVLTGAFYVTAAPSDPFALDLAFKALPMALTIAYAALLAPADRGPVHVAIVAGLAFSVLGDVTIHRFLVGLSAFLVAHLWYLGGFATRVRRTTARVAAVVPLALVGVVVARELLVAVADSGDTGLVLPVALYVVVILAMAWAAILTGNRWAAAGSLSFVASDTILAWNMFVESVPHSGVLIMTTYMRPSYSSPGAWPTSTDQDRRSATGP